MGYGRINTSNSEIWPKAVMCARDQFPQQLVGALIDNPTACYAARGLSVAATAIKGQTVRSNSDGTGSSYLINAAGAMQLLGWKDNWSVYNGCGMNNADFKENWVSLHDLYKIPRAADFMTPQQCLAALAANPVPRPTLANRLVRGAVGVYRIDAQGYKHAIGAADALGVCYSADSLQDRGDLAGVADGAAYPNADACLATIPNRRGESRGKLLGAKDNPGALSLINRYGFRVPLNINALQIISCGFPLSHSDAQYTLWLNTTAEVNAVPLGGGAITTVADCKSIRTFALQ